ncbi:pentapeptide repeat-containing protein [Amycolatopsis suaedae]|uniref:pentapeptide repeat-containing protein n=1 Tax=Amycolatopsis suaedae TaxID=2510978 RepID=UPI0013EF2B51|nr:pentapeptide repeat-containing protein [Amycolatopsis suaedae]
MLAGGGFLGFVWLLLGPVSTSIAGQWVGPVSAAERLAAVGSVRGLCVQLVLVVGGLVTASVAVRRYFVDRDKQRLEEDKHVTDRLNNAIGHLGSEDETVRAGGIRTLARIMADSPRDHRPVVDTLAGALRGWSARSRQENRLPDDVAAALMALRTRPSRPEDGLLDLAGVRLNGANLAQARLVAADLSGATLDDADLRRADLTDASLSGTRMTRARLTNTLLRGADAEEADFALADLTETDMAGAKLINVFAEQAKLGKANLSGACLRRARLRGAIMTGVRLDGADLAEADLRGVDLRDATGLTAAMLAEAVTDRDTQLPDSVGGADRS